MYLRHQIFFLGGGGGGGGGVILCESGGGCLKCIATLDNDNMHIDPQRTQSNEATSARCWIDADEKQVEPLNIVTSCRREVCLRHANIHIYFCEPA